MVLTEDEYKQYGTSNLIRKLDKAVDLLIEQLNNTIITQQETINNIQQEVTNINTTINEYINGSNNTA